MKRAIAVAVFAVAVAVVPTPAEATSANCKHTWTDEPNAEAALTAGPLYSGTATALWTEVTCEFRAEDDRKVASYTDTMDGPIGVLARHTFWINLDRGETVFVCTYTTTSAGTRGHGCAVAFTY